MVTIMVSVNCGTLSSIDTLKYNKGVEKYNFNHCLSWLFLRASFRSKKGLITIAEKYDISLPQLYLLVSIKEPLKMSEIARLLMSDPSNATGIIDRLFERKLITRKEDHRDRRQKLISLTPTGLELQKQLRSQMISNTPEVFEKLSDSEKKQLSGLLLKIIS